MYIYPTPLHDHDVTKGQFVKRSSKFTVFHLLN